MTASWFDDAAGPVVRPYAMTRGRTHGTNDAWLDLIAVVVTEPGEPPDDAWDPGGGEGTEDADGAAHGGRLLGPEHLDILALCRRAPTPVAEVAADLDLPVGVVRVLVGDLIDAGLVSVTRPVPPAELPDEGLLRDVIDGLRAL